MARVPYLTRDDLTQEHQAAYDRTRAMNVRAAPLCGWVRTWMAWSGQTGLR